MEHSNWSPSGFKQIMLCPGSKVLQAGAPRTTSAYAAEGTAAHQLLTWALEENLRAGDWVGDIIDADGMKFVVDEDMARHVQVTLDYVHDIAGEDGIILVDRRVHFGTYLGVPDEEAFGTLDVAVLKGNEVIAIDLKYGMGVEVEAGYDVQPDEEKGTLRQYKPNPQLALYALGILAEVKEIADVDRVRLVISQPRVSVKPSEYDLSVEELEAWARGPACDAVAYCQQAEATAGSGTAPGTWTDAWADTFLHPGEEQCRFCKAKATCPAVRDEVAETVQGSPAAGPSEFADLAPSTPAYDDTPDWLAACLSKVDLIEDWCKAVRAEVERRLLAGEQVPGYKVVQGKQGNRAWSDPAAAEELLRKVFRLPVEKAYDLKLISPTSAEKLAKAGDIGPRQWPKAESLITRAAGKPHVAPLSDPRPALTIAPVVNDFESVNDFS